MTTDPELLSQLSEFGYTLHVPERRTDPNALLARLVASEDTRLLEGFPVVLANALARDPASLDLADVQTRLPEPRHPEVSTLSALSQALFDLFGLGLKVGAHARPESVSRLSGLLAENKPVQVGARSLDPARLKATFRDYVVSAAKASATKLQAELSDQFRKEFLLSLVFSPKQRDLVRKKLGGEPMTKTEREYYSRVVKKKLAALADPELHQMAQKALTK